MRRRVSIINLVSLEMMKSSCETVKAFSNPQIMSSSYKLFPVLLCLTGAMLSSLGMILQKIAHKDTQYPYYTNPKWYSGFVVYSTGDFVLFLTLWYLPQAVVAVLGTWTLVANLFFAVFLLDEKIGRRDLLATVLIFSGTSIAVYSYRSDGSQYTASQLWSFLHEASFQGFVMFIIILLIADLVWLIRESTPRRILVRISRESVRQRKRSRSISYIFAASIVNTLVMLLGKCVAALASVAWYEQQSVYLMITSDSGVFLFIFVACGLVCILNVHLVNKALESGDALVIVPAYFVLGLVFKVTSGIIFFQDYLSMTYSNMVSFSLGCLVNVVGVYVTFRRVFSLSLFLLPTFERNIHTHTHTHTHKYQVRTLRRQSIVFFFFFFTIIIFFFK